MTYSGKLKNHFEPVNINNFPRISTYSYTLVPKQLQLFIIVGKEFFNLLFFFLVFYIPHQGFLTRYGTRLFFFFNLESIRKDYVVFAVGDEQSLNWALEYCKRTTGNIDQKYSGDTLLPFLVKPRFNAHNLTLYHHLDFANIKLGFPLKIQSLLRICQVYFYQMQIYLIVPAHRCCSGSKVGQLFFQILGQIPYKLNFI